MNSGLQVETLKEKSDIQIPKDFTTIPSPGTVHINFMFFPTKAFTAVSYLKVTDNERKGQVGFIMGKTKLASQSEHSIPRPELCAAVLATKLSELISSEIDINFQSTTFYTDSNVVLGYIHNEARCSCVLRIHRSSHP